MFVKFRRFALFGIFRWQWKLVAYAMISAGIFAVLEEELGFSHLRLPDTAAGVVGAALGIFVAFRTNAAYDRWWEARKLWGQIVNSSRHFAMLTMAVVPADVGSKMIHRQIAWVHLLRNQLKGYDPKEDDRVAGSLPQGDVETVFKHPSNQPVALMALNVKTMVDERMAGRMTDDQLLTVDLSLRALTDAQGGCERLLKTPLPIAYGYFAKVMVQIFAIIFPLALVDEIGYLVIPVNALVVLSFGMINEVGRVLEAPFSRFYNAVPINAISVNIERDLRGLLQEDNIPEALQPNHMHVLM